MRTPEQRVIHQEALYNIAMAAFGRAEQAVLKAAAKKTSAIQYANNNVIHAKRAVMMSEAKLPILRSQLAQAEEANKNLKARLTQSESEVCVAGSRYDASITACEAVLSDMKRKLDTATELYVAASNAVEHQATLDHAETLRTNAELLKEKSPEQHERLRKIAFDGGTTSMNETLNNVN